MPAPKSNKPKVPAVENNGLSNAIIVKPYSTKELSFFYGVHSKTFGKWLIPHQQEVGKRIGRFYTALQVKKIFMFIGPPSAMLED